jgi:GT2 family glycosyltransferase
MPTGWLAPLLEQLRQGAAIAAPVLIEPDGTVQSAGHRLLPDGFTEPVTDAPVPGSVGRPDFASAACWVLERSTYDTLDGFDDSFFPAYYEDADFALRARPLGGTTVVGDVRVVHHRGASTDAAIEPDTTPQRQRLLDKWPELAASTVPSA